MKFNYLDLQIDKCPICDENSFTILNENDRYFMGLVTVGCNECGMIQTNPRPTEVGLLSFYENDYRKFYQGIVNPDENYVQKNRKQERFEYTVGFLKKLVKNQSESTILDVGCSEGSLFSAFRKDGFEGKLYGVEPNMEFAHYAELKNKAKVYGDLDKITEISDLIVVNHVFEHFLKPSEFLNRIKLLMDNDSILYIDVPDADEYNSLEDLHLAHLFHYTSRTLTRMLERCEFDVIKCEKHNPPFHPKSIRLIAKKRINGKIVSKYTSPITEMQAWKKIKRISTIRKRVNIAYFRFKILISKIPFAKKIYKAINKWRTEKI